MEYSFHNHTADIRYECEADSFEELLIAAAQALYAVALVRDEGHGNERRVLELAGPRAHEEYMVRFLQDLIYLLDTEHFVADLFTIAPRTEGGYDIELEGCLCSPDDRAAEVKAATYHGCEVRRHEGRWIANIVLDV
ncbi:MAG TPA: archease [Candidatus Hydrogenedentes bacterium]|nr:archease [Candidatus Hydrogenedentota bacterium]HOS02152.1 archease [Candidatus Hydrogenedentota bacterium]